MSGDSLQVCATRLTIQWVTGGPDVVGYCRKPLFHRGPHDIYATTLAPPAGVERADDGGGDG